jgi:uncharacterized protein YbaP (TraB family)
MKKLLLAALMALACTPALAAEPTAPRTDADPALWVVRDDDTTIYLFGTFHLLDERRDWFNDEVRAAFDRSAELVLEAKMPENPADLEPLIRRYAIDPDGRRLSQRLSAEQNQALGAALTGAGVPAAAFDMFEPWFASMTLSTLASQRLGITGEHGPEAALASAARERGMAVAELEGFEFQLRMFDGMPEAQQLSGLGAAIRSFETIPTQLAPLLAAWSEGDLDRFVAIMNAGYEQDPEGYRMIFTDRNRTWAEWIDQRLDRPGTVFMAVGAGHLAGRDSVQHFLAQRGIAAERVAG